MNNNPRTLALARFPNLANIQVIVVFTINCIYLLIQLNHVKYTIYLLSEQLKFLMLCIQLLYNTGQFEGYMDLMDSPD